MCLGGGRRATFHDTENKIIVRGPIFIACTILMSMIDISTRPVLLDVCEC